MKLAIVVGHTKNKQGAFSQTLNSSEYPWNTDLANRIAAAAVAPLETKIFFRDGVGIDGAYAAADAWGSEAAIELHFNSSDSAHSTGTGVLYLSPRGKQLATLLCQEMMNVLALPAWPRGTDGVVTPLEASGVERRGESSLKAGRAPAALIEPFFGSNKDDCAKAAANKAGLARAIVAAVNRF
jgi:N-acetylmuramoyl-L-alanine amidase